LIFLKNFFQFSKLQISSVLSSVLLLQHSAHVSSEAGRTSSATAALFQRSADPAEGRDIIAGDEAQAFYLQAELSAASQVLDRKEFIAKQSHGIFPIQKENSSDTSV